MFYDDSSGIDLVLWMLTYYFFHINLILIITHAVVKPPFQKNTHILFEKKTVLNDNRYTDVHHRRLTTPLFGWLYDSLVSAICRYL